VAGWQRSPIQAWSGLSGAGSVRPGCGGMSAWAGAVSFFSTSLRGKWGKRFRTLEFFEFFFFFFFSEMTCQYVIGGHQTLVLCHDLKELALFQKK
jgi:hypothetical protein